MKPKALIGNPISPLDTPAMIVDIEAMSHNIAALFKELEPTGVSIRPHLKTCKSATLASWLLEAGAVGGCVAKISEAEALRNAGYLGELLVTSPVIGAGKVAKAVRLGMAGDWDDEDEEDEVRRKNLQFARDSKGLILVVDSEFGARDLDRGVREWENEQERRYSKGSGHGEGKKKTLRVLVDVDVGLHRTGVQPGEPALRLAEYIRSHCKNLQIIGVQGYEGHLQHLHSFEERKQKCLESMAQLTCTADLLRLHYFAISIVTTGGTGTADFCASVPGITEVQPGSFMFMDTDYRNAIGSARYKNSLTILATVISKQGPRRVTIDAGLKSLTTDSGLAECKDARFKYDVLGDEHGSLTWEESAESDVNLEIGDLVEMVPSHIDPTINLHGVYYGYQDGVIQEVWKVDARGKVQ